MSAEENKQSINVGLPLVFTGHVVMHLFAVVMNL